MRLLVFVIRRTIAVFVLSLVCLPTYAQTEGVISDIVETPRYGVLVHHLKVQVESFGQAYTYLSKSYVGELYRMLAKQDGAVKDQVRKENSRECSSVDNCNYPHGLLLFPEESDVVMMEFSRSGGAGAEARYRAFLKYEGTGSMSPTKPVLGLDFDMEVDAHGPIDGVITCNVTTMLTGMGPLDNNRLPSVSGAPGTRKCIGCAE